MKYSPTKKKNLKCFVGPYHKIFFEGKSSEVLLK